MTAPMSQPLWSASYLAFVRDLDSEQVLAPGNRRGGVTPESRAEWREICHARRMEHCYGTAEAVRRLNAEAEA